MNYFNLDLPQRLALVVVSGLLAYPAMVVDESLNSLFKPPLIDWWVILPGAAFGLLVLAPFLSGRDRRGLRIAGLMIAGIAGYELAINVPDWLPFGDRGESTNFAIAGLTGALLAALAVRWIASLTPRGAFWPMVVAAGIVGGFAFEPLFNLCMVADCDSVWLVLAHSSAWIIWQGLVFLALHYGRRPASVPAESASGVSTASDA